MNVFLCQFVGIVALFAGIFVYLLVSVCASVFVCFCICFACMVSLVS